jgi:hypothetical protein
MAPRITLQRARALESTSTEATQRMSRRDVTARPRRFHLLPRRICRKAGRALFPIA